MAITFLDWLINFLISIFLLMFGVGICCLPFYILYKIITYFLDKNCDN